MLSPRRSTAAPHTCGDLDGGEVRTVKFSDAQPKEKGANQNGNRQPHQRRDDKSAKVESHAIFFYILNNFIANFILVLSIFFSNFAVFFYHQMTQISNISPYVINIYIKSRFASVSTSKADKTF